MTADEALHECARAVAQVMVDLGFLESEAAHAADLIVHGDTAALRDSILADVIEPDGTHYRIFAAYDDAESARLLARARASGASVSTSCTILDATQSAWRRLWGSLGPIEPEPGEAMH